MICRLSPEPPISCFTPCWYIVHVLLGTILISVWSQFRIKSRVSIPFPPWLPYLSGILSSTDPRLQWRTCSLLWALSSDEIHLTQRRIRPVPVQLHMPSELHQYRSVILCQDNAAGSRHCSLFMLIQFLLLSPSSNTIAPSYPRFVGS